MPVLVSAQWVKDNLDNVRVIDASSHLPTSERDADVEFAAARIPGAVRFDINKIADHSNPLPHMIPSAAAFAVAMCDLGLSDGDHLVIYDDSPIFPAARVWWMFRLFGHDSVSVLNGGLNAWKAADGALETTAFSPPAKGRFTVRPTVGAQVIDMMTIRAMMEAEAVG